MGDKIKILLADDHQMVRMGLSMMINSIKGFECVGQAEDGDQVVDLYDQTQPDIVLLDVFMPRKNGIRAAEEINQLYPNSKILIMTAFTDNALTMQALEAGAMGIFEKNILPEDFEMAVKMVIKGKIWVSKSAINTVIQKTKMFSGVAFNFKFSERETEIGKLLMQGKTNSQIAKELNVSVNTIKKDLSYLYAKLKVTSRAEATTLLSKSNFEEEEA